MAFTEQIKLAVKIRAHFRCCLCHSLYVEIHHIIPESEDGPDSEENAAPLCPSCHETYGANPEKRKFIWEARDFWYEFCEKTTPTTEERIRAAISDSLKNLATKEDIERLSVQNSSYTLGSQGNQNSVATQQPYSFFREEYINLRIMQELKGWISDSAQTVAAIDLVAANKSNRYHGDIWVRNENNYPTVGWNDGLQEFCYRYLATSPSGVHMVECFERTGGTGVFTSVELLAFDFDRSFSEASSGSPYTRQRVLLKTLGSVGLGDRYAGTVQYKNGFLRIGPDDGWFKRGDAAAKVIPIR